MKEQSGNSRRGRQEGGGRRRWGERKTDGETRGVGRNRAEREGVGEGREKKREKPLADTGHNLIFTVLGQLYRVICHGMPLKLQ